MRQLRHRALFQRQIHPADMAMKDLWNKGDLAYIVRASMPKRRIFLGQLAEQHSLLADS